MNNNKINIKGLTESELLHFAIENGESAFRGKQLFQWLYRQRVSTFDEMLNISKILREKFSMIASIETMEPVSERTSAVDGTMKFLFKLSDGKLIESVLIPSRSFEYDEEGELKARPRTTLCISTQVGCPLDCKFCATGTMGFERNLTVSEIVDQVLSVKNILSSQKFSDSETMSFISNVVFMGMGEPMLNYDNVMKAIEILSLGVEIPARRITISTAGYAEHIRRMADEDSRAKLAISLHSLDNTVRTSLMPITKKYSVETLLDAAEYYYAHTKQRITFEYILFDGLNDTAADIRKLASLAKRLPCKINIIPFHSISFTGVDGFASTLRPTPIERREEFIEELRQRNVSVFVRASAGEDIEAACGQLAVKAGSQKKTRTQPHFQISPTLQSIGIQ